MYLDVAVGARYECRSVDPRTKRPLPSSLPTDMDRPNLDVFKSADSDFVGDGGFDELLSTSSTETGDPVLLPPPEFCFRVSLSFGIFMLLKRLLRRLLDLVGVFTSGDGATPGGEKSKHGSFYLLLCYTLYENYY